MPQGGAPSTVSRKRIQKPPPGPSFETRLWRPQVKVFEKETEGAKKLH
jgi:hypothetical protein